MIILTDFDDTAAVQNVGRMLLERSQPDIDAPGAVPWRAILQRYADGEISLAEYQETAFRHITAPVAEQTAYVRANAQLRPGFAELAQWCAANDVPFAVVSHGLDYYVGALLDAEGVSVPFHCVRTSGADGKTFEYAFADPNCAWRPGNCKCKAIELHRRGGERVVYAGDGRSDACPAARADFVFAREPLAGICRERGLPHAPLSDFRDVLAYAESRGEAGPEVHND